MGYALSKPLKAARKGACGKSHVTTGWGLMQQDLFAAVPHCGQGLRRDKGIVQGVQYQGGDGDVFQQGLG